MGEGVKGARSWVVIGQRASASSGFSIDDLPGTSGRVDVLARCVRAALLFSHGLRRDTAVYLVLLGGPAAPRTVKIDGATARFVRPDERALGVLVKKALAAFEALGEAAREARGFVEVRAGVSVASAGVEAAIAELGDAMPLVLEAGGVDVRDALRLPVRDGRGVAIFVGDHLGFEASSRARVAALGATPVSVGPVMVHAEDAIAIATNELDRRDHGYAADPAGSSGGEERAPP